MRVIMMGTGPFAVPTFRSLLDSPHEVLVLVTRPSAAVRSRGKVAGSAMRAEADQRGLRIAEPEDVNAKAARAELAALEPDLLVVCDYGQILSAETLALAPLGGINLHGSLLPKYRGAAPVNWALVRGETETGVSVIHMTPRMDAGPCLAQRSTRIDPEETAEQLEPRLAELGPEAVHEAIGLLEAWDRKSPLGTLQDPSLATRAPRLKKSDGQVDWSRTSEQIRNQVRGLKPWPGTFTYLRRDGRPPQRLILDQVSAVSAASDAGPGCIVESGGERLWVATGGGVLAIQRLQPAGKRVMDVAEFLRGHPLRPGMRFG